MTGRFPETAAWTAAPKQPPVDPKKPIELWKGSLDEGSSPLITVTLMQGKGEDAAKIKDFTGKLEAANKAIADLGKPTLASADELKKLAAEKVKADRAVISKVKDTFSREKNTDHYGGQFSVILWNNKGKVHAPGPGRPHVRRAQRAGREGLHQAQELAQRT